MQRELFNKFSLLIDLNSLKEESRELWYLYNVVFRLHSLVNCSLSYDEVAASFWAQYPEANKDIYTALLDQLKAVDVSDAVGEQVLQDIARKKAALRLSEESFKLSQGLGSLEVVQELIEALKQPVIATGEEFTFLDMDLDALVEKVVNQPGLRWRLDCLNKALGSLRKGNFGFLFARPETGKTTFLASEVAHMLDQTDKPIVWFNNEQVDDEVGIRIYQAYFGITLDQLKANQKQYRKLWHERVGRKFLLVPAVGLDCGRVERICASVNPSLIIYDQIDKIKGFKADRDDLVYGAIYQWARELSKTYAPSIGVCQADGTAEGVKWLTMAHVANAKTSKQAEADWILGIGKTNEEASQNLRYFSICKNKLMGDGDSIPALRHGHFETLIQPELARFKDIVQYA